MICLWTEYSFEYRNASILHEKKCAKKEEADRSYLEYTLATPSKWENSNFLKMFKW